MTNGELAFLALAEELNFTRAAEKLYISQQGLSDHIKRLEEEYDTTLVTRKPHVALTETGLLLRNMLLSKQTFEKDLKSAINDINQGDVGTVNVGIALSRLRVYACDIVQNFYEILPKVEIYIIGVLTVDLIQQLERGDLDIVIGVNAPAQKVLHVEPLFNDPVYLVIPDHVAAERTGDAARVRIQDYEDVPFIRDFHDSTTNALVDDFLTKQNVHLKNIVAVSDYNVQAALCNRLDAAMFCSKSFAFFSRGEVMMKGLRVLEIENFKHEMTISIITNNQRVYPKCVYQFIDVARESLLEFYNKKIAE